MHIYISIYIHTCTYLDRYYMILSYDLNRWKLLVYVQSLWLWLGERFGAIQW